MIMTKATKKAREKKPVSLFTVILYNRFKAQFRKLSPAKGAIHSAEGIFLFLISSYLRLESTSFS